MPSITIPDVPADVCDALANRAAQRGESIQEYLRRELIEMVPTHSNHEIVARARERVKRLGLNVSVEDILAARDADRP